MLGGTIELTGFGEREARAFITSTVVEDEGPGEPPADPITNTGDLWILGDHRLLCGDSTKAEDVARLLDGQQAALILADPPYYAKVDAEWDNDFEGFEGFLDFLRSLFALWAPNMMDRGTAAWWCAPDYAWHIEGLLREHFAVFNHVVWSKGRGLGLARSVENLRRWLPRSERLLLCEKQHSPDALLASFNAKTAHIASRSAYRSIIDRLRSWLDQSGLSLREIDEKLGKNGMAGHYFGDSQWALPTREAWDKMRPLFAARGVEIGPFDAQRSEFDAQRSEFDAQRSEFDAQRSEFDAQRSEFDASVVDNFTDVWDLQPPSGDDRFDHPTPKPLALISKLVSAHSRNRDVVADPFAGTGPTIIAAEQLGRRCYAIEIAPAFCDVIVARWEKLTGRKAVRE